MANNFPNEVVIAYSPIYKKQLTFGTALVQGDLTAAFKATVKRMTPQLAAKVFVDCSTQFLQTRRTMGRWTEIEIEFETDPQTAAGWFAFALGSDTATGTDPLTHQENMLAGRLLPVTTLRIGFDDGVDVGWIVKDVCVADISLSARSGFDSFITCRMRLLGSGNVVAGTGTTWPVCYAGTPSTLFDASASLVINAVEYKNTAHAISCRYANNPNPEAAFVAGSDEVSRWIRSRVRDYTLDVSIEGADTSVDVLATLARANKLAGTIVANTVWTFGTANNTFSAKIPSGYVAYQGQPQDFLGDNQGEVGVLNLTILARKATSSATEPFNVTAVIAAATQAVAYLTT